MMGRKTFSLIGIVAALTGCRAPMQATLRPVGPIDLDALTRLHPGWTEVRALDAKIARLQGGVASPSPLPLPRNGAPPITEREPIDRERTAAVERREMERLTQERVAADYEALAARLDREVAQFEAVERAAGRARSEAAMSARADALRLRYNELARRYAERLGPLLLRRLGIEPGSADAAFYPSTQLEERAKERARLTGEIDALRAERDRELRLLAEAHEQDAATIQSEVEAATRSAASRYRAERIAQLRVDRDRQQRRLMEETGRALAAAMGPMAPGGSSDIASDPAGTREREALVARVVSTNKRGGIASARIASTREQSLTRLREQRSRLAALLHDATRATATTAARESGWFLRTDGGPVDQELTRTFSSLLRRRWQNAAIGTRGLPL